MLHHSNMASSFQGKPSPIRQRQTSNSQAIPPNQLRPTVDFAFHQHVSEELKKELEVRMILETKLMRAEEKIKESENIKAAYHNILADNQKLTQILDNSSQTISNLENKIGVLLAENEKLRDALEKKLIEFDSMKDNSDSFGKSAKKEMERLKNEIKRVEAYNEQIHTENGRLKLQVSAVDESMAEKSILEEEIDSMRRELTEIQLVLQSQKEELDEYQELEEKSEILVMENQKLNKIMEELKDNNSQLSNQLFELSNRSKAEISLVSKMKERPSEMLALREQLNNLGSDYELLVEEHNQLKESNGGLRKNFENVSHSLLEKKAEIDLWKSKLSSLEHRLAGYESKEYDYTQSISEFQDLLTANEELANENRQMAATLSQLENSLETLKTNRANQEALIRDYMAETDSLRKRNQEQQILLNRMNSSNIGGVSESKFKRLAEENGMLLDRVEVQEEQLRKTHEFMKNSEEFLRVNQDLTDQVGALEEQLDYWKSRVENPADDRDEYVRELESKLQMILEENEKIHEMYLEKSSRVKDLESRRL